MVDEDVGRAVRLIRQTNREVELVVELCRGMSEEDLWVAVKSAVEILAENWQSV